MICRIWRGWATPQNAPLYEEIVRGEVIPEIEARRIPGFRAIDLMRRSLEDAVEFVTIMWFDDINAVTAFVGEDYEAAHVPQRARDVLSRFDERSAHYEISTTAISPPPDQARATTGVPRGGNSALRLRPTRAAARG